MGAAATVIPSIASGRWIPVIPCTRDRLQSWSYRSRGRRLRGPGWLYAGTLALAVLCSVSCSELPEDLLVVAPPHFGAGTAEIRIVIGSGVDVDTLEVAVDGVAIAGRLRPAADTATDEESGITEVFGTIEIAAGEHELYARAQLRSGAGEITHRLNFTPPPALDVTGTDPPSGTSNLARSDWIRLELSGRGAPAQQAIDSIGLSCDGQRREISVHRVGGLGESRLVVDPHEELPPDSRCRLSWRGPQGKRASLLTTGPARPSATVLYDRRISRQLAPFPDDFWLAANPDDPTERGVRLRAAGFGLPDQWLINALATGVRSLDGFSPLAHFTLALSAGADESSLPSNYAESIAPDASVLLFDVTQGHPDHGARIPFRIEARSEATRGPVHHALLVFPSVALKSRHRYGLVVTNRVRSVAGESFGPSAFFSLVRDSNPAATGWAVERARALAHGIFEVASTASIPISRREIAFAARFSIRSLDGIADDLVHIENFTSNAPAPTVQSVSIEALPLRAGDRNSEGDGGEPALAAVIRGLWSSTHWLDNESRFARDPDTGLPVPTGSRRQQFTLALPRAAFDGPVPVVMYQHGNPGSAEEEVVRHARRYLAAAGFAVVGFDDAMNRGIDGSRLSDAQRANRQIVEILVRILASSDMPDFFAQTIADQIAFVRTIGELAAIPKFRMPAGSQAARAGMRSIFGIDPTAPLLYLGISEGAHHGSMLLPFTPQIRAAALVSPGRRFAEVLIHQNAEKLLEPLWSLGFGQLSPTDIWVVLALIQMIFDDQDPNNFAPFLYREPLDITPASRASVLMIEGLGDSFVPNHATHALARALGPVVHLAPASRPVAGLETAFGWVAANVDPNTTAALYQYVPQGTVGLAPTPGCASPPLSERSAREGHYCAQSAAESIRQRVEFLRSALEDEIPRITDPLTESVTEAERRERNE